MQMDPPEVDESRAEHLEATLIRFLTPLEVFIHKQTTAAVFLLVTTVVALVIANSPWSNLFNSFASAEAGIAFRDWQFMLSLRDWIGSGLMALFFFLIGLEIKREVLAGKLRDARQITLIVMAALGGMIFPAALYALINHGTDGAHGWAIPMATDTAFALGVLALLMRRVSPGVSVFVAAMAIFDDIGAIAVISIFYGHGIHMTPFLFAALVMVFLLFINIIGVRNGWVYAFTGIILWALVYQSGLHATLAGLLMAIAVPARTRLGETGFVQEVRSLLSVFEKEQRQQRGGILSAPRQHSAAENISEIVRAASTPLQRWEASLIWPIGIVVLPLFALFNAGVSLAWDDLASALSSSVTQGILLGLVVGKPLGIVLMVAIGLKLKAGRLPEGMRFTEVVGAGMLAGIGFTMSLFITMLSFDMQPDRLSLIDDAKTGILLSSLLSALGAVVWLCMTQFPHHAGTDIEKEKRL
ncbi:MAG: Na+/H+ antiporter NhaA [Alphaproteobacteria bacterium]|nr:Na+/H+ antiporter NhaA [Alphaproteobacteria bacterium]